MTRSGMRRLALVLAVVVAISVGLPPGMPVGDGSFPLGALKELLSVRVAWSAVDPVTPQQGHGAAVDRGHRATSADTRANGGSGRPRTKGAGELELP